MSLVSIPLDPDLFDLSSEQKETGNNEIPVDRHRELIIRAKDGGKHYAFLRFVDHDHGWNNVPLGQVEARRKDAPPKKDHNVLVPVVPVRLVTTDGLKDKDRAKPLRNGWFYVFVDGYLWREFEVTDKSKFKEVNLAYNKGRDNRRASTELDDRVILPYKINGKKAKVQVAYSEVQWSWAYINRMGGMYEQDFRTNKFIKPPMPADIGASKSEADKLRTSRMQNIDLSGYRSGFPFVPENNDQAAIENISKAGFKHIKLKRLKSEELATIFVHDTVGLARILAAEHTCLVAKHEESFEKLQGVVKYKDDDPDIDPEQILDHVQGAKFHIATFLANYFYHGVDDPPEKLTEDQKKALNKRKEWRDKYILRSDLESFTNSRSFRENAERIILVRKALVDLLEDETSHGNFTVSVADAFALSGTGTGKGHGIVADIIKLLYAHPFGSFKNLELDVNLLEQQGKKDTGYEYLLRLVDAHPNKPALKVHSYLFPAHAGQPSSPESIDKKKIALGMPEFDVKKYQGAIKVNAAPPSRQEGEVNKEDEAYSSSEKADWGMFFKEWFRLLTAELAAFQLKTLEAIASQKTEKSKLQSDLSVIPKHNALTAVTRYVLVLTDFDITLTETTVEDWGSGAMIQEGLIPLSITQKLAHLKRLLAHLEGTVNENVRMANIIKGMGDKQTYARWDDLLPLTERLDVQYQYVTQSQVRGATTTSMHALAYDMRAEFSVVPMVEIVSTPDPHADARAHLKHNIDVLQANIKNLEAANQKVRNRHLTYSGAGIFVVGVIELWNFGEAINRYDKNNSSESLKRISIAAVGVGAVLAEMREWVLQLKGINTDMQWKVFKSALRDIQRHGIGAVSKLNWKSIRFQLTNFVGKGLIIVGNTIGMYFSFRDFMKAMFRSDPAGMLANGLLFIGGIVGFIGMASSAFVWTGVGLVIVLAAIAILLFFSDEKMVTWLKNMPFGSKMELEQNSSLASFGGPGSQMPPPSYFKSRSSRYGGGNKSNWGVDNDYYKWKDHPEFAYLELMDLLFKPEIKWDSVSQGGWKYLTLELKLPNYLCGESKLDAELIFHEDNITSADIHEKISLFSKGKSMQKRNGRVGSAVMELWDTAQVTLLEGRKGYRIEFSSRTLKNIYKKYKTFELIFRARVHPLGEGQTLFPQSNVNYVLPQPEWTVDGKVEGLEKIEAKLANPNLSDKERQELKQQHYDLRHPWIEESIAYSPFVDELTYIDGENVAP